MQVDLTSKYSQYSEEDKKHKEATDNRYAVKMATRKGERDKNMAEGASGSNKEQRKRERKFDVNI